MPHDPAGNPDDLLGAADAADLPGHIRWLSSLVAAKHGRVALAVLAGPILLAAGALGAVELVDEVCDDRALCPPWVVGALAAALLFLAFLLHAAYVAAAIAKRGRRRRLHEYRAESGVPAPPGDASSMPPEWVELLEGLRRWRAGAFDGERLLAAGHAFRIAGLWLAGAAVLVAGVGVAVLVDAGDAVAGLVWLTGAVVLMAPGIAAWFYGRRLRTEGVYHVDRVRQRLLLRRPGTPRRTPEGDH